MDATTGKTNENYPKKADGTTHPITQLNPPFLWR